MHLPIFPHSRLIRTTRLLGTLEYEKLFYRFCLSVSSSSWPCSTFFDSFLSVPKSSKIITEVSCTPTASILRGKVILPQMLWTVLCAKSGNWYLDDLEFAFVLIWTQNCTENWRRGSTLYQARNSCLIFSLGFFHVSPELFQDCISSSQMIRPISDAIRVGPVVHKSVTLQVLSLAMHQQEMRRISYVHSYLKNFGHSARHGAFP